MFTVQILNHTFEGRKKLVIEHEHIYIDHQIIPVSAKEATVTGYVENFESDESVSILRGSKDTWIAQKTS
jgi:hypothetical protein